MTLIVLLLFFLFTAARTDRPWPIDAMNLRLTILVCYGGLTLWPWVTVLLVAQNGLRKIVDDCEAQLRDYLQLWDLLTGCLTAFATFVVLALLPTGALRSLWLAYAAGNNDLASKFPSSDVLLYGALFATILGGVTIPVLVMWRNGGRRLIAATYPVVSVRDITQERLEARQLLEAVLHLRSGVLKSPLAAFSIFLPLVTSVVAAFVPEIKQ